MYQRESQLEPVVCLSQTHEYANQMEIAFANLSAMIIIVIDATEFVAKRGTTMATKLHLTNKQQ